MYINMYTVHIHIYIYILMYINNITSYHHYSSGVGGTNSYSYGAQRPRTPKQLRECQGVFASKGSCDKSLR